MRKDPFTGKPTMHNGIDIAMPKGAPVGSTVGGTVVYAGFGQKGSGYGGYGNVVVVKDAQGNLHQYSHLDSLGVKIGQQVASGSVVGKAGSTGRSTGSHLDYMVKGAKGYIDPTPYITRSSSSQGAAKKLSSSSSYTNTYKIKEASKSPSYTQYLGHLKSAISSGLVPKNWAIALTELVGRESSWNPGAKNPSSSARGYGQFINATVSAYQKKTGLNYSNPVHQLAMMARYVKDRYGSPEASLKHWDAKRWY